MLPRTGKVLGPGGNRFLGRHRLRRTRTTRARTAKPRKVYMSPEVRSELPIPQSRKPLSEKLLLPYVPKYEGSSQVGAVRMIIKDDGRGILGCASRFTSEGPRAPVFPGGLLITHEEAFRAGYGER